MLTMEWKKFEMDICHGGKKNAGLVVERRHRGEPVQLADLQTAEVEPRNLNFLEFRSIGEHKGLF